MARPPPGPTRVAAARRRIAEADTRLGRDRVALEEGGDAKLINQWIAETQANRLAATTEIAGFDQPERTTADDLAGLIDDIEAEWGSIEAALQAADPNDKAALLSALGVSISYDPVARTTRVTSTPLLREKLCRRGDSTWNYQGFCPADARISVHSDPWEAHHERVLLVHLASSVV